MFDIFKHTYAAIFKAKTIDAIMASLEDGPVYAFKIVPGGTVNGKLEKEGYLKVKFTILSFNNGLATNLFRDNNIMRGDDGLIATLLGEGFTFTGHV